jgi:hypothetical protein
MITKRNPPIPTTRTTNKSTTNTSTTPSFWTRMRSITTHTGSSIQQQQQQQQLLQSYRRGPHQTFSTLSTTATTAFHRSTITRTQCLRRITILVIVIAMCTLGYFDSYNYYFSIDSQQHHSYFISSFRDSVTTTTISSSDMMAEHNVTLVHSVYDLSNYHSTTTTTTSITERMTNQPESPSTGTRNTNISAAVCYKTLFGTSIDIGLILQWIGTSSIYVYMYF